MKGAEQKDWYYPLYSYLRDNGVDKIELKIIDSFDDIKDGFNYKREVIEEKAINFCLGKNIILFNKVYPCKFTETGEWLLRTITYGHI